VAVVVLLYAGLMSVAVRHTFSSGAGVRVAADVSGSDAGSEALGTAGAAGGGGSDGASSASGGSAATGGAGGGSGSSSAASAGAAKAAQASRASAAAAPGAAGGDLPIGVEYDHDNSAAYNAIGAKGVASGDQPGEIRAVVGWINAHGGMGGRKVTPVLHESTAETSPFAAQAQSACSDFTEDHHVAAVVGRTSDRDDLYRCLAPRGIPYVAQNRYLWDQQTLSKGADTLYAPGTLGGGRWDRWVDALATTGFFNRPAVIGVARFDTPAYERTYREVIEPAIRRHGTVVTREVVIHQPESVSAFGGMNGEVASAVLQLRSAQVDHVIILDEGTIGFFMLPQAESQNWHPVYGLHSQNIPQVMSVNAHAAQLTNSVGAGWVPTLDVDFAQDPGMTAGTARCMGIYKDAGIKLDDRVAQSFALRFCDSLFFLKETFDRAGGAITPAALRAAAESLGSSHVSALTFTAVFGAARHDGADQVRPFRFDRGCGCFRYL
jgi:hypothetical protein